MNCDECNGRLVVDEERGEFFCENCFLVHLAPTIDPREPFTERTGVNAPPFVGKDAKGGQVDRRKMARVEKGTGVPSGK